LRKKNPTDDGFDESQRASKSQRRREALETKSVAAQLIALKPSQLARVPLDDSIRSAIEEARLIKTHIARKRQLQFVAKLLRRADAAPVLESLESFHNEARQLNARQHRTETWRDRLLESGDNSLSQLMAQRPDADAQVIRQLIRNAQREAALNKPPAAARSLFRLLRDLDEIEALPPCG
jgi:ribosome-associated protein